MSSKSNIITLPNESLRKKSLRIGMITNEVAQLIKAMEEATLDWEKSRKHEVGVALAAVQIDKLYKVIIIRNDFDKKTDKTFQAYINPKIVKKDGDIVEDFEGCLSIKDIYGKVPRHSKVKIKATDLSGNEIRLTAEGFLARVFQHEIDHTEGKLFIDHIKDSPNSFFELDSEGQLTQLGYEKQIKNNSILW